MRGMQWFSPIPADKGRRKSFEKIAKSKNTKRTKKAGKKND